MTFLFSIVFLALLLCSNTSAQTDYSAPFTVTLTNAGINRFLASQWSSMTKNWTGNYQGLSYSVNLEKPTIYLTTNTCKIFLTLNIVTSVYTGKVNLTPTLSIPSTTINADNIISQYENLHQQIISSAQLVDPRLQAIVEQALSPINWIIYKGKILNSSTARLVESADIQLSGLPTLEFNIRERELDLTITPTITATQPNFSIQWMRNSNNFGIRVISNDKFTIDNINIPVITILSLGVQYSFTLLTTLPVTAVFNNDLQKYTAEYIFKPDNVDLANGTIITTKIDVKRGLSETLWLMAFTSLSSNQSWTYSNTSISVIRGE